MNTKECYEIRPFNELLLYLKENNRSFLDNDYQLQNTHAFVYELTNGKIVVLSGLLDENVDGYLFHDTACFRDIITNEEFPVKGNQISDPFELEKEIFKNLPEAVNYYFEYLASKVALEEKEISKNSVEVLFNSISKNHKRQFEIEETKDLVAISVLVGELLRMETSSEWKLEKRYGYFNSYYEPFLSKKGKYHLGNIIMGIQSKKSFEKLFDEASAILNVTILWKTE